MSRGSWTKTVAAEDAAPLWAIILVLSLGSLCIQLLEQVQTATAHESIGRIAVPTVLGFFAGTSLTSLLGHRRKGRENGALEQRWEAVMSGLEGEERALYGVVVRGGGSILQNDLCDQAGFSRSKVCRLLARMEARGVLEKRRCGMSNLVILR